VEIASELSDVKALLSRREADIARLREHRDQQSAELHERKHKDNVKMASCEEYKALATSRAVGFLNYLNTNAVLILMIGMYRGPAFTTATMQTAAGCKCWTG